jgi:hypothetical protein
VGNFYFEQLFQTALAGIDGTGIMGMVLKIAGVVLIISFLFSAYQAFTSGGDVRMLAVSAVKYLILGLVFASYGSVFREVNGMFNDIAGYIYKASGVGDVFATWLGQLAQYWQANGNISMWNLVTGLASGIISLLLIMSAFVIFPVCYLIFTVFYAMYGSVLYVTGPFVLALLPIRGLGQLSRTYLVNLIIFEAWGLVYAILQVLMTAVNLGSINAVLNANGILQSFVGSSQMMLLALTAILFSFSIALIPYIASRIVRGDVGSTLLALAGTATAVTSMAVASAVGFVQGAAAGAAGAAGGASPSATGAGGASSSASRAPTPLAPAPAVGSAGGMGVGSSGGAVASSSAPAPMPSAPGPATDRVAPSAGGAPVASGPVTDSTASAASAPMRSSSRPGAYRRPNLAHAVAWHTGYSVGSAYRKLKGRD